MGLNREVVVSQCYFCPMQSLKTLWKSVTPKPVTGHLASFTVYTKYFYLPLFKLSILGEQDSGKAELTWCLKYLISELTPERQLNQCLYPEGAFLTANIRKPGVRMICQEKETHLWRCQCWVGVLGCSHLLPAPSQSLPAAASFIQVSTRLSCPLVTTRSNSPSVD